jgi:hypothetical protein
MLVSIEAALKKRVETVASVDVDIVSIERNGS